MNKKICLDLLKITLTPWEMKNITGGSCKVRIECWDNIFYWGDCPEGTCDACRTLNAPTGCKIDICKCD